MYNLRQAGQVLSSDLHRRPFGFCQVNYIDVPLNFDDCLGPTLRAAAGEDDAGERFQKI